MKIMEYKRFGDSYVIRFDRGDEIVSSLLDFCSKESVKLASVEGIGASDHVVIGLYNVEKKQYHKVEFNQAMEITSLLGNISVMNDKPYLHLHINLCDENMKVIGGHLNECRISATGEIIVRLIDGIVDRRLDSEVTGLNLFKF